MNRIKDFTIALAGTVVRVALVILAIICIRNFAGKAYEFGYRIFAEEPMSAPPGRDINVVINESDSQDDIFLMLEDKGIIKDHLLFKVQKKLSAYKEDIEPGSYDLNTSLTTDEILKILARDDTAGTELSEPEELSEVIDPESDDVTGLESGGVLAEESQYDEGVAFEDEVSSEDGEGETANSGEFDGEGDEESAIEE